MKEIEKILGTETNADQLMIDLGSWQEQKIAIDPDGITRFAKERSTAIGLPHSDSQVILGKLLIKIINVSPLPPVNLSTFVDSALIAQASNGNKPLAFQQIACLNYASFETPNGQKEQHVLEVNEKTIRWQRFIEEERDFLIALNEAGIRPLVVFGVSDILDFEEEDTFALSAETLKTRVEQNRQHMTSSMEQLNQLFGNLPLANPHLRPKIATFSHSQLLQPGVLHLEAFRKNLQTTSNKTSKVESFRLWLIEHLSEQHQYLTRLNPNSHLKQLTQMMALYATDNQLALENARRLFPDDDIEAITSLCLQPNHEPEWITEKMACEFTGVSITQLTPFPNAGKWWQKPRPVTEFSQRSEMRELAKLSPSKAFAALMKKADATILLDIDLSGMQLEEIITAKRSEVIKLVSLLFGHEAALKADVEWLAFRETKQKKAQK